MDEAFKSMFRIKMMPVGWNEVISNDFDEENGYGK